ncbi:MAG: DUF4271 domain-containing protein [Bacteroidales bacterium]|nr:DUF4271 domain-containing protein [Bacteroidales bacterium]
MKKYTAVFEFAEKGDPTAFERASMFEGHLLQPINAEALPMPDSFSAWIFALLFFSFVVAGWLLNFGMKYVRQMPDALFGNRGFGRLTKERNLFSEQLVLPFIILILLCFSLFALRVGMLFGYWDVSGVETLIVFGQLVLVVGLLLLLKIAIIKVFAWVFKEQASSRQYLLNLFVFNASFALLFLPFLLVSFLGNSWFQTNIVYAMIFLFAVWFIWRAIRSFLILISATKFSYVHNFLYLCTLEIGYYLSVYLILSQH